MMTNRILNGSSQLLTHSFQSTQTGSSIQLQSLPVVALRPLAAGVIRCLYCLLHQTSDLSSTLKTWHHNHHVLCHNIWHSKTIPSHKYLFSLSATQLWLQSRPPLALQAAPQLSTAVIHPHPAAGSLWNCPCQAGLDRLPVLLIGGPPHPLLPHVLSFSLGTEHEGCEPLSFHQDSLFPWDGSVESGFPRRELSAFPHGLQKSLPAFSVICQRGYSSLLLGTQPTQQSSNLTYIFNTTFHLTLLSDLSVLQYRGWLLRSAASWTAYPTDTQSFAQQIPTAFRGCEGWKGTRRSGIWWKCSYCE